MSLGKIALENEAKAGMFVRMLWMYLIWCVHRFDECEFSGLVASYPGSIKMA